MSARIFVLPRCTTPPASAVFETTLEYYGFDMAEMRLFNDSRGRHELVRLVHDDIVSVYERMDGTRFSRRLGQHSDQPEAA